MRSALRLRTAGVLSLGLLVLAGCSTRGENPSFPSLPRIPFTRARQAPGLVYTGSSDVVYRTVFEAVVAEFNTSPRIVKPERGLLVFTDQDSEVNTSIVITTVGENASTVHIETRGNRGILRGRSANAIRARLVRALDERLARAEEVVPLLAAPRGTSALVEKQDALERLQNALGFDVLPGYLIDMEAQDLRHLAAAVDRRVGMRELTVEERRTSAELALDLGKELHDLGRYDEARKALEHAVNVLPASAVAHCNLGEIYKHLRDFDLSLMHLREAQRLDASYAETYINLGIVYDDYVVDDAKALKYYRKYLDLGGADPRVHEWIQALEADA